MESVSVAPARVVATVPSPTLKRKSPLSPVSELVFAASSKRHESISPAEIVDTLVLAPQSKDVSAGPEDRKSSPASTSASQKDKETLASSEQTPSVDDYEKGLVVCGNCGEGIPFRDPQSGGFTLRLWDLHRDKCRSQKDSQPEPIIFAPETTVDTMVNPPLKKRRAKRTEEERIEYLRTDPYVAQFEAYRVLCGSCNKWIRLRPNSTYCSIPWDAHRKSCLSKKANSNVKASVAAEGRNAVLHNDPDVRRFDAERVMCAHCDRWIPIHADGGYDALQNWYSHKVECRARTPPTRLSFRQVLPAETRQAESGLRSPGGTAASGGAHHHPTSPEGSATEGSRPTHVGHPPISRSALHSLSTASPTLSASSTRASAPSLGPLPAPSLSGLATGSPHTTTPSSIASSSPRAGFKDLHLGSSGNGSISAQDSRRRNAEQRAAALRADPLLKEVEPNRVFCRLCGKWVQLRQDSSYCAYPWHQHRGKCLARYQRRQDKTHDYTYSMHHGPYDRASARYGTAAQESSRLGGDVDAEGELEDELESEDDRPSPRSRARMQELYSDSEQEDAHEDRDEARRFAPKRKFDAHASHGYARPAVHAHGNGNNNGNGNGSVFGRYKLSAAPALAPQAGAGRYATYVYGAPLASNAHVHAQPRSHSTSNDVSMDEDYADGDAEGDIDVDMDGGLDDSRERE